MSETPEQVTDPQEAELTKQLLRGDEAAYRNLLERLHPGMVSYARSILRSHETAEEVVQDTWLAVLRGLERFEGRSSLKTWLFSIVSNKARSRLKRERRQVAFSDLVGGSGESCETIERRPATDPRQAWMTPRQHSSHSPEDGLLAGECLEVIEETLGVMPKRQAEVVMLRDVRGWSADEVCHALDLSSSNQKVLLHRGRHKLRLALNQYDTAMAS